MLCFRNHEQLATALSVKILFICTGNICRSVMAAALLAKQAKSKKLKVECLSAGIGAFPGSPPPTEVVDLLKKEGQNVSGHRSTPLMPQMFQQVDLVLTMTKKQQQAILGKLPAMKNKVHVLKEYVGLKGDVADPIGGNAKVYAAALKDIDEAIRKLVEKL